MIINTEVAKSHAEVCEWTHSKRMRLRYCRKLTSCTVCLEILHQTLNGYLLRRKISSSVAFRPIESYMVPATLVVSKGRSLPGPPSDPRVGLGVRLCKASILTLLYIFLVDPVTEFALCFELIWWDNLERHCVDV